MDSAIAQDDVADSPEAPREQHLENHDAQIQPLQPLQHASQAAVASPSQLSPCSWQTDQRSGLPPDSRPESDTNNSIEDTGRDNGLERGHSFVDSSRTATKESAAVLYLANATDTEQSERWSVSNLTNRGARTAPERVSESDNRSSFFSSSGALNDAAASTQLHAIVVGPVFGEAADPLLASTHMQLQQHHPHRFLQQQEDSSSVFVQQQQHSSPQPAATPPPGLVASLTHQPLAGSGTFSSTSHVSDLPPLVHRAAPDGQWHAAGNRDHPPGAFLDDTHPAHAHPSHAYHDDAHPSHAYHDDTQPAHAHPTHAHPTHAFPAHAHAAHAYHDDTRHAHAYPALSNSTGSPAAPRPSVGVAQDSSSANPCKLFVKGFPLQTTKEDLAAYFSIIGPISDAFLGRNKDGGSRGFGFVVFRSLEDAKTALALTHWIGTCKLGVERARPKQATRESRQAAQRQPAAHATAYGSYPVSDSASPQLSYTPQPPTTSLPPVAGAARAGLAPMTSGPGLHASYHDTGTMAQRQPVDLTAARSPRQPRQSSAMECEAPPLEAPPVYRIFVGGMQQDTREAELKAHFGQFGDVVDAEVMIDKTNMRSKGYGFVTFAHRESMVDALRYPKQDLDGCEVDVKIAHKRETGKKRLSSMPLAQARRIAAEAESRGQPHALDAVMLEQQTAATLPAPVASSHISHAQAVASPSSMQHLYERAAPATSPQYTPAAAASPSSAPYYDHHDHHRHHQQPPPAAPSQPFFPYQAASLDHPGFSSGQLMGPRGPSQMHDGALHNLPAPQHAGRDHSASPRLPQLSPGVHYLPQHQPHGVVHAHVDSYSGHVPVDHTGHHVTMYHHPYHQQQQQQLPLDASHGFDAARTPASARQPQQEQPPRRLHW